MFFILIFCSLVFHVVLRYMPNRIIYINIFYLSINEYNFFKKKR
ncbi:Uncharacterized protein dnm_013280 [Desulfonema magnum]|uniref:Uncharacterized protein n=1 Tax=Desulfonema magnum TaxID=45655 RepID=A0A975BHC2_9BACT|nr:Uncharacterized protein dnm_013280 [Desulfonema magnum]